MPKQYSTACGLNHKPNDQEISVRNQENRSMHATRQATKAMAKRAAPDNVDTFLWHCLYFDRTVDL